MESIIEAEVIKVAIQGGAGAFHEMAAAKFFEGTGIEINPCETFDTVFIDLATGKSDCGIVAIENSVAGSILPNYALLRRSGLKIAGEVFLRIKQNLMALPGESIENIREIHSHPVAIQQCSVFLDDFRHRGVKIVETSDTALSAKWIRDHKLNGIGALASSLAAKIYNLEILAEEVEADRNNFTRFLMVTGSEKIIGFQNRNNQKADKASMCFSLPHEVGSLSQILSVLAFYNINLTKIQSLPIVGKTWEYLFHIDLVFNDYQRYRQALSAIGPLTDQLEIFGEYKQGEMPDRDSTI
jgi:prephenate dehydratase